MKKRKDFSSYVNFNDYYLNYYLPKHRKLGTKILHLIGVIFTICWAIWSIANLVWWAILLIPFVVYPFAFAGHWIIERNRPAAISGDYNLWWAKLSDFRMCWDLISGNLPEH